MQLTVRSAQGNRRHSLWYERILLSFRTHLLLGMFITVGIPTLWQWGWAFWNSAIAMVTLVATAVAYLSSINAVHQLSRFPGTKAFSYALTSITVSYFLVASFMLVCDVAFAQEQMLASYVISIVCGCAGYLVANRYRMRKIAVVPVGDVVTFCQPGFVDWRWLDSPDLKNMRVDGIVADLDGDLNADWQRFLAECTIQRIPIYNARRFHEEMTGKVGLHHIHENKYGLLVANNNYEIIKRAIDFIAAFMMLPVTLPIIAVAAFMIKRDDPGPVFFKQKRLGFQGREFYVYKLRSMYVNPGDLGPTAEGNDPRITRVGKQLRKYRIDELPQLFNVLKGDMSLIGPRPETPKLTEAYERDIPFFRYRHVVRPGISGWAQIEQGYVSEVEGSKLKLEYDFYYIKNFSFWIDVLIVIRTIRTIFTGSGAR